MHAALGSDVFAEKQHPGIDRQFMIQRAANGGDHVDPRALRRGLVRRRRRRISQRSLPALFLDCGRIGKDKASRLVRVRHGPLFSRFPRGFDRRNGRLGQPIPFPLRHQRRDEVGLQAWQRVAAPFSRDRLG